MLRFTLKILLVLLLGFHTQIQSQNNEDTLDPFTPLINLDCYPSSVVNGTVNVISGNYCEQATDLVIPGPEPLVFSRANIGSKGGWLYSGWTMNHHAMIYHQKYQDGYIWSGKFSNNYCVQNEQKDVPNVFKVDLSKVYGYGGTNCGSGDISGKSNLKNCLVHMNPSVKSVCFGDGSTQEYRPLRSDAPVSTLSKEKKANGNQIIYSYDRNGTPAKIETKNSKGDTALTWATYSGGGNKTLTITASNGSFVHYDIPIGSKGHQVRKVSSSENPDIEYVYHGGPLSGYLTCVFSIKKTKRSVRQMNQVKLSSYVF